MATCTFNHNSLCAKSLFVLSERNEARNIDIRSNAPPGRRFAFKCHTPEMCQRIKCPAVSQWGGLARLDLTDTLPAFSGALWIALRAFDRILQNDNRKVKSYRVHRNSQVFTLFILLFQMPPTFDFSIHKAFPTIRLT